MPWMKGLVLLVVLVALESGVGVVDGHGAVRHFTPVGVPVALAAEGVP
jgi:hypothetical protein